MLRSRPTGLAAVAAVLMASAPMLLTVPAAAQQPAMVRVDAVRIEPLRQTAPVVGRFVACRAGPVAARVSGPIGEMRVEVGDRVEKGDVMAVLVRDRFAAEMALRAARVAEAEAAIVARKAELELRRQELRRLERLRRSPAFSEGRYADKGQEVLMTEADLSEAESLLARAHAELRLAEIAYRESEVRAPYGGVVSKRHTEIGAHVDPGAAVVSLIDDGCVEIEADVPQVRARSLAPAMDVRFDAGDGERTATVRAVIPDENPLTRTRAVRFTPGPGAAAGAAPGQSVTLWLPAGAARDVPSVHKDAIVTRGGAPVVFVVEGGTAALRPVRLGEAIGSRFEVLDGLAAGDLAVVRGNERLQPGQPVEVQHGAEG